MIICNRHKETCQTLFFIRTEKSWLPQSKQPGGVKFTINSNDKKLSLSTRHNSQTLAGLMFD